VATRILLVEDDATIGEVLAASLRSHAYDVIWVRTGAAALTCAAASAVDLIVLDLGLPDLEGTEVCRLLRRAQPGCVLVILTARSAEMDVVVGLDSGADDYLVKPVRLAEFHARLRAHLRRNDAVGSAPEVRRFGDLVVDVPRRRVTVAGRELRLRPKEFDLLARLAAEPDVALRRETLMSEVWDEHWFGSTKTLDVHVAALRRRIAEMAMATAAEVPEIVTLRGHGYRLELPAPKVPRALP
jgi:DNA-binding response OmpR family regulator